MGTDTPDHTAAAPTSRRALLASVLSVGATVPFLARGASAGGTSDPTTPTTTTPPTRSDSDAVVLNGLITRENDAAATYTSAAKGVSGDERAALETIRSHHVAYAEALAGLLGRDALPAAGTPQQVPSGGFAATAAALAELEGELAGAHIEALASIEGTDAATLVASIITVTARHRAAIVISSGGTIASLATSTTRTEPQ